MRTILLGICISIASTVLAQRECGSSNYLELQKSLDPSFATKIRQLENFTGQQAIASAKTNDEGLSVIRIPVVVRLRRIARCRRSVEVVCSGAGDLTAGDCGNESVPLSEPGGSPPGHAGLPSAGDVRPGSAQ